jgi:hypothetical protein
LDRESHGSVLRIGATGLTGMKNWSHRSQRLFIDLMIDREFEILRIEKHLFTHG